MLRVIRSILYAILFLLLLVVLYGFRGYFFHRLLRPVIIDAFHILYYDSAQTTWTDTRWRGSQLLKNPLDLWIFQEIIWETRPDVIIEAGTYLGGSALYLANLLDLDGRGKVVTIDIEDHPGKPQHSRIHYILGSSTSPETVEKVKNFVSPGDRVMAVLDSDHHKSHVLQEMRLYGKLVTKDCYLIVEDTNINGHPALRGFGPGPMEAVEEFLGENAAFVPDRSREKFLMTHNPKGYLRRVR